MTAAALAMSGTAYASCASDTAVHVIASVRAAEGKIEILRAALAQAAEENRKHAGNLSYEVVQDQEDTNVLVAIEKWESKEALEKHLALPEVQAFIQNVLAQGLLSGAPSLRTFSPVR
jgi:quinol monooxygenase YgiN